MKKHIFLIAILTTINLSVFGQFGKTKPTSKATVSPATIQINTDKIKKQATTGRTFDIPFTPKSIGTLLPSSNNAVIKSISATGLPTWIEGTLMQEDMINRQDVGATAITFMDLNKKAFKLENPAEEFVLNKTLTDDIYTHSKYNQFYKGIEVWNSEIIMHFKDGIPYLFNGRFIPTPNDIETRPGISLEQAVAIAKNLRPIPDYTTEQLKLISENPISGKLVIYTQIEKSVKGQLAYLITAHPSLVSRYQYFIDANTGQLIDEIKSSCSITGDHKHGHQDHDILIDEKITLPEITNPAPPLDGPETANAVDLNGVTRTINTYLSNGNYFLLDASRPMFNSSGPIPNDPTGAILTVDAGNKSPENDNFSLNHVTSSNNTWSSKASVSAHFNAGIAYEYFRTRHNRNSINGSGGTIISIINVTEADGSGMDNAFWNGANMYYGNGNTGFKPLAGSLDVAGHEMSHGVVQETANLTYQGESGAMNESFADVFGVLIDRDDYRLGEDVVKLGEFPSGALRDMSNPNNGGNSLSDGGYQPDHYSERYTGSQDNGGVHINSGILNFAFFKVATRLGKDDAEKIYYAALSKYLTKSSQFIDARNAVIQAGKDLYGNNSPNIAQIENSFAEVGIGAGSGTTEPPDYGINPGEDFVIFTDDGLNQLKLAQLSTGTITDLNFNSGVRSKPSVSDDGSLVVFVGQDNVLYYISFDWAQGQYTLDVLDDQNDWRNASISKDGQLLAGLLDVEEPYVYIFDLIANTNQAYELINPTTGEDIFTGDVEYADAMEFDHTGEYLMYDALSSNGFIGNSYWDIGFIKVYNKGSHTYGDGFIEKLYTSLPDGVSVGNPVFSKNSPNVIAFDYFEDDGFNEIYQLLGANIENGNTGVIFENSVLSYPCFSKDDNYIIFNANSDTGSDVIAIQELAANKITPTGNASILIDNSTWGTWFATGEREINALKDIKELKDMISVYPNPSDNAITVKWLAEENLDGQINVLDVKGQVVYTQAIKLKTGDNQESINISHLPAGAYFVEAQKGQLKKSVKLIKN